MKTLLIVLLMSGLCFAQMPKPDDRQNEVFQTVCYDWLERNWQTVKKFEDGGALYQPINKMELMRVENSLVLLTENNFVESDTEIYHIAVYFTSRYLQEGEWLAKQPMLQVLYLHIRNGRVILWDAQPAVPYKKL